MSCPAISSPLPRSSDPWDLPDEVATLLRDRGCTPGSAPGEDPEDARRRMETELMALFRDTGLHAAFEALYSSAGSAIQSWIVHLLTVRRQESDPTELLQDTFVNAYRYARSFREDAGGGFRCWARTIAANVVRRARRRRALPFSALADAGVDPIDARLGPDRLASSSEQIEELRKAWVLLLLHYAQAYAELSPRDREALRLVEVEGLTYEEAGGRLKVGRSNMKMIMFRSRKRIRGHILRAMQPGVEERRLVG